jgi:xanthine dehydrogenase accessory factor
VAWRAVRHRGEVGGRSGAHRTSMTKEHTMSIYDAGAGDAVALARVVSAVGLGARWPGQVALVRADGQLDGSLLGGAFDAGLVDLPAVLDPSGRPGAFIDLEFDNDEAERVGLPCGGQARVLVQPITALPLSVRDDIAARRPTAVLTELDRDDLRTRAAAEPGGAAYDDESSPDSLARSLLVRGEPADAVTDTAEGRVLVSVLVPSPHLAVIGSGALAQALEAQLALLGWTCEALTRTDDGVVAVRRLGPGDGVLVIDHRGEVDFPILSTALAGEVGYVAALGSRRTQEARRSRLREGGVPDDVVARLRGPAGLDIGSRTPAEIAVAIVAEMLSVRSTSAGGALRDGTGSINRQRL